MAPGSVPVECIEHALYTAPGDRRPCRGLRARGAPGDRLRLAFDVADHEGVAVLTLTPTALRGEAASIPADDIDIRVITHGGLLVPDDRVALTGAYRPFCGHLHHLHRLRYRPHFYRGPRMPRTGFAATTLAAGERKQMFVHVHIRDGVPPGRYEGAIELAANGVSTSLPLSTDVAPLVLHAPPQLRMLWYLGTLDCRRPRHYVNEQTFRAQLQDIWDHGFTAISLHETKRRLLRRACRIARAIGFSTVVLEPPYPDRLVSDDLCGLRLICYVSDEPDRRGEAMVAMHREHMRAAGRLGAATLTSLVEEPFARRFVEHDLGRRPDLISIFLPENRACVRSQSALSDAHEPATLYYWLTNAPDLGSHRLLTGMFLWKSRAAGISPYCYQHLPPYPGSPWDDDLDADGQRRQMATYPASPGTVGCIPTLRWEAMADGITDLRYLVTVTELLARASSIGEAALCAEVAAHLTAFGDACLAAEAGSRTLTTHEFEAARETLASDALALQRALAMDPG